MISDGFFDCNPTKHTTSVSITSMVCVIIEIRYCINLQHLCYLNTFRSHSYKVCKIHVAKIQCTWVCAINYTYPVYKIYKQAVGPCVLVTSSTCKHNNKNKINIYVCELKPFHPYMFTIRSHLFR